MRLFIIPENQRFEASVENLCNEIIDPKIMDSAIKKVLTGETQNTLRYSGFHPLILLYWVLPQIV